MLYPSLFIYPEPHRHMPIQDGEVINKIEGYECENRRVLHTAMRDVFDTPNQAFA